TVKRLRVFGGICCDHEVGGLNPAAVEVALRTGARVVWMPTFSSVVDRRKLRLPGPGIPVIGERARLVPAAEEILRLAREHDAVVATGHIAHVIEEVPRCRVPAVALDRMALPKPPRPRGRG